MDAWTNDVGDDWEFERQHNWFAVRPYIIVCSPPGLDRADVIRYDTQDRPVIPTAPAEPAKPEVKIQPSDSALASNEALVYALRVAPNVLYSRFKEFGELGVLGWCDEFRELIDAVIETGFEGALFTSTREVALLTCSQLLRLDIDLKMQIIIIYLSAQVARLRRFLDGDLQYEDYPDLRFPKGVATPFG